MKIFVEIYKKLTKIERHVFHGAAIIFFISALMLGILIFESITTKKPASSNIYREGVVGQPIAINPVISGGNGADADLEELLFSDLVELTKEYKVSANGQTWNLILKDDLRWSDGKPLTSDDVIFTIDTIQDTGSRSPLLQTWQGVVIDRISELEIEINLRAPYIYFLDNLKDLRIIPKHIFGTIPPENIRLSNFNLEPVGSGPYKFSSFEKKKDGFILAYHLATNEYYSGTVPYIENFDVNFYPSSALLTEAFNSGEIDGFGGINQKYLDQIKLNYSLSEKIIPQYYAIFLNKNSKTALADKEVIKAFNFAVNKQEITEKVFDNKAMVVSGPILPVIEGYDTTSSSTQKFSVDEANALLDKSGWKLNAETSVREKKIKKMETLEFSLIVPQIPFLSETAEIIKENWAKIGVKLNLIALNPDDIANDVLKTRNYEMMLFGNILKSNPDIFSFWHSSQRFYPGLNLALYENKKVDGLLESIRKNTDENLRKIDIVKLQQLISADNPAIFLYSPIYLYVAPKDFGGFDEKIINTPADRFRNAPEWYLETTRVFK